MILTLQWDGTWYQVPGSWFLQPGVPWYSRSTGTCRSTYDLHTDDGHLPPFIRNAYQNSMCHEFLRPSNTTLLRVPMTYHVSTASVVLHTNI